MNDWELKPARDLQLTPLKQFRSVGREGGLLESILRATWWSFVRFTLTVFHRVAVHNRQYLPNEPPFILVANHESHMDALVLGAALPLRLRDQLFPLAAGDVFFEGQAIAAFSAMAVNALPVWRGHCGKYALVDLRNKILEESCAYILFPEGTRSRTGQMSPFRSGVGALVAGTPIPIVPCYLSGTFKAFPPGKILPRFTKISLFIGEPIKFEHVENNRAGWDSIATTTESAVKELAELAGR